VVKPAPGIPTSADGLPRLFARFRPSSSGLALCPGPGRPPQAAAREAHAPYPRGPWLRSEFWLSRPLLATMTPSAGLAGTRRLRGSCRLYAAPSLCGSASATRETFPTFSALLSPRAADPTPVGPRGPPVMPAARYQASSIYERVAAGGGAETCLGLPTFSGFDREAHEGRTQTSRRLGHVGSRLNRPAVWEGAV
jgi:hypothetical protein